MLWWLQDRIFPLRSVQNFRCVTPLLLKTAGKSVVNCKLLHIILVFSNTCAKQAVHRFAWKDVSLVEKLFKSIHPVLWDNQLIVKVLFSLCFHGPQWTYMHWALPVQSVWGSATDPLKTLHHMEQPSPPFPPHSTSATFQTTGNTNVCVHEMLFLPGSTFCSRSSNPGRCLEAAGMLQLKQERHAAYCLLKAPSSPPQHYGSHKDGSSDGAYY